VAPRRKLPRRRLVTLTSDVGSAYAAQMKVALIVGGVDPARIVDLAHDLPAHGVAEGAFLLREMVTVFPSASIHVAVIDPGVGGPRSPIVIETHAGPWLVGPDNGVLMPLAEELGIRVAYRIEAGHLSSRPRVGTTFDGRDIFAPAAARLATGTRPAELGPSWTPMGFELPRPSRRVTERRGTVVHVDRFGNLITNLPTAWFSDAGPSIALRVGGKRIRSIPWVSSYEALDPRTLGALGSSFGLVELAVREGRADKLLDARVGTSVTVVLRPGPPKRGEISNSARPRKRR